MKENVGFLASSDDPKVNGFFSSDGALKANPAFFGSDGPAENATFFSSGCPKPEKVVAGTGDCPRVGAAAFDSWKECEGLGGEASVPNPLLFGVPNEGTLVVDLPAPEPNRPPELAGEPKVNAGLPAVFVLSEEPKEKVAELELELEPKAMPLDETLLPKPKGLAAPFRSCPGLGSSELATLPCAFQVLVTDSSLAAPAPNPNVTAGLGAAEDEGEETRLEKILLAGAVLAASRLFCPFAVLVTDVLKNGLAEFADVVLDEAAYETWPEVEDTEDALVPRG